MVSAPSPSRSTLKSPSSSTSSLSHWMTVRSGHGRVLDRHQVVHRLVAEQKAAGVDRQVAREVDDLAGQAQQVGQRRSRRDRGRVLARQLGSTAPQCRQLLGGAIERGLGQARAPCRRRARLERRGSGSRWRPWRRDRGRRRDRRAGSPPRGARARCRDRCRAARRARATGSARTGAHAHRIDRGDAEAVAHRRVGRRAAALTQDALATAELHDLVHRQEVAAVVELLDERELALELGATSAGTSPP
jgi:hypothetical protein